MNITDGVDERRPLFMQGLHERQTVPETLVPETLAPEGNAANIMPDSEAEEATVHERLLDEKRAESEGTKELFKQNGMYAEEKETAKEELEERLETLKAIARIKNKLAYGRDRVSDSAVRELLANGVSLEKMSFGMLSDVINQIGAAPNEEAVAAMTESVMNRLDDALPDDGAITALLKQEGPVTPERLYVAAHSSADAPGRPLPEDVRKELEPEVDKAFEREGVEKTPETAAAADFLLENELPVTRENIEKTVFLKNLKHISASDAFRERVAAALRANEDPARLSLEAIAGDMANDTPAAQRWDSAITVMRQRAETRYKMTLEAAARLAKGDIEVDTEPAREALERIKNAENEVYSRSLRIMGADDGEENVSAMSGLYDKIKFINPLTSNVHAGIINKTVPFTINGIHDAVLFARAHEGYEQFATVPDPRHGDYFASVTDQFAPLLESSGIEATDANVKAAAILSRNNIDVTAENVTRVRTIDDKIDYVNRKLHPTIAASIIKDGINPVEMDVDDIMAHIDAFDDVYGENTGDKLAEYIRELDMTKTLTAEERAAMLAIYRVLHTVAKNGAAALGVIVKNDGSLTLNSLLEASKYYVRTNGGESFISADVDDSFGMLEELVTPEDNIAASMRKPTAAEPWEGGETLPVRRFAESAGPKALRALLKGRGDMPLEEAAARLEDINEEAGYSDEKIARDLDLMKQTFQTRPSTIYWMEQNGLPTAPPYMLAMSGMRKDPFFIGRTMAQLEEEDDESDMDELYSAIPDASLAALMGGASPEETLDSIANELERLKESETSAARLDLIQLIQNAIKVQSGTQVTSGDGGGVKLPVRLRSGIAGLNMYVFNEKAEGEDSSVVIALNTKNLGDVQIVADISGGTANLTVASNDPDAAAYLERNRGILDRFLKRFTAETGVAAGVVRFGGGEPTNTLDAQMAPRIDFTAAAAKYEASV